VLLRARGLAPDGRHPEVPAVSTIAAILRRCGRVETGRPGGGPMVRFEHAAPNELWQMDFKGHFALTAGGRCHTLAVVDDHSRFALLTAACPDESGDRVRPALAAAFQRYGLPRQMLADNGPPWGCGHDPGTYTRLEVWLLDQGVSVTHGRAYHPQTQGKQERFNRTMGLEALAGRHFATCQEVQRVLDGWRERYNHERPHEAIGLRVPAERYAPSPRRYDPSPRPPEYPEGDETRTPNGVGQLSFRGRVYKLGEAFGGRRLALRPGLPDGVWTVHYRTATIATLDQRDGSSRMC
jgi:transposase InsO family protein